MRKENERRLTKEESARMEKPASRKAGSKRVLSTSGRGDTSCWENITGEMVPHERLGIG